MVNNKTFYTAAVIGTGRIGYLLEKDKKREQPASHSRAFKQNKRIRLIAGADIDDSRLQSWHKAYPGTRIYADYKKLLQLEKPDIVVIAVDETAHLSVTTTVISYQPRLIVLEKPVAPNLKEANRIKKLSAQYQTPILINHERRFSLDYLLLKKILNEKTLGTIHTIQAYLWSGALVWKKNCEKDGACSLIHDGTHLVDIIHFLFNEKLKSPVIDHVIKNRKKEVRSLLVHYQLKHNCLLYLELSGLKKYFGFELEVRGSEGRTRIGNGYFDLYLTKPSPYYTDFYSLVKDNKIRRPHKTAYLSNMVQHCIDFLDGKAPLVSPIDEGVAVLKVLDDIVKRI